ncbi:hypothetical protein KIPB_005109 [Kipferlia bialata]|uniref:Uncharacterized protein n=1 Tax=Kipferlia bialata TaxID=797122 RepID=A0A391NW44_9EUKA|nr:hypothetical protein KIPB_005109 [Kipferlia bialata]|eukprot:g5109.t1
MRDAATHVFFALDAICYVVVSHRVIAGNRRLDTLCMDTGITPTEWVMSTHPTPRLCNSSVPLPVIGGRVYGLSTGGSLVSFNPREGWVVTKTRAPHRRLGVCLLSLGHYLLVTQKYTDTHFNTMYHWCLYDTISGEVAVLPDQTFGGDLGMFTPALAVMARPNTIHYIDPALVYPHHGMRWGIIPPSAVVVPRK